MAVGRNVPDDLVDRPVRQRDDVRVPDREPEPRIGKRSPRALEPSGRAVEHDHVLVLARVGERRADTTIVGADDENAQLRKNWK